MTAQDDYNSGKLDPAPLLPSARATQLSELRKIRAYVEPVTAIADRLQYLAAALDAQTIYERVLGGEELSDAEAALRSARAKHPNAEYPETVAQINELRLRIALWDQLHPHLVQRATTIHRDLTGGRLPEPTLQAAFDAAVSREAVLRGMAMHLATNDDGQIVADGGARHLAVLALSRCYTQEVLEDGSCFDPYTAAAADMQQDDWPGMTTGPISHQDGDLCLSCGTHTRPDGSCECAGWDGAS